jgi:hypothetical protein
MSNSLPDCISNELKSEGVYLEPILGVKEFAWKYDIAKEILKCLSSNEYLILGIDVLKSNNGEINYAIAFWAYDYDTTKSKNENISESCSQASQYIDDFHNKKGGNYIYVFIFKPVL